MSSEFEKELIEKLDWIINHLKEKDSKQIEPKKTISPRKECEHDWEVEYTDFYNVTHKKCKLCGERMIMQANTKK